jgi:hypothetical protein
MEYVTMGGAPLAWPPFLASKFETWLRLSLSVNTLNVILGLTYETHDSGMRLTRINNPTQRR